MLKRGATPNFWFWLQTAPTSGIALPALILCIALDVPMKQLAPTMGTLSRVLIRVAEFSTLFPALAYAWYRWTFRGNTNRLKGP